jgi:hypothetical protein
MFVLGIRGDLLEVGGWLKLRSFGLDSDLRMTCVARHRHSKIVFE